MPVLLPFCDRLPSLHRLCTFFATLRCGSSSRNSFIAGFGDSPGTTTTVFGMYNDSLLVYKYIRNNSGSNTIIVWGHSMGTA